MTEWTPEATARYHDEMQRLRGTSTETPSPAMYEERIRLLEAERQQAIDALREISQARSFRGPSVMGETVEGLAGFARAALVKLGDGQ